MLTQTLASLESSPNPNSLATTKESNKQTHIKWKAFVALENPSASHMILRNLLLGKPLKNGFTPITSKKKLANGHRAFYGFECAYGSCFYTKTPFAWAMDENLSEKEQTAFIDQMREKLKEATKREVQQ